MLVLSRKASEQIQIGENITITVVRIDGARVRIGIDAPKDVHVVRSEIAERPPADNRTTNDAKPPPRKSSQQSDRARHVQTFRSGSSRRRPDARRATSHRPQARLAPATLSR